MLGLHYCSGFSLLAASGGCSLAAVLRLPVVVSLVERRLYGRRASAVAARGSLAPIREYRDKTLESAGAICCPEILSFKIP